MTPLDQYLTLVTPVAFSVAVMSGIAFAWVLHHMRADASVRLVTYLTVVLAVLWYPAQATAAWVDGINPWGTLGRMTVFLVGFVIPMHLTLRWLQRGDQ